MKSAIFDIIGGMINKVVKDAEIRGKIKIWLFINYELIQ
jgi:hypothetical protein